MDLVTGASSREIATSKRPAAIALSPDGARAYVLSGTRKLAVVDLVALRTVKSLRVGRSPFDARGPSRRRRRVRDQRRRPLRVGGRHGRAARRAHVRLRRPVAGIALSPNGDRAVVGPGRRSRKAIVLSTRGRGKRTRRISAGKGPSFVAFSPTGARIYFANSGSARSPSRAATATGASPGACGSAGASTGWPRSPGYSLIIGTPGPDTLKGDRGPDLVRGLGAATTT